jgi:hypothetical protein
MFPGSGSKRERNSGIGIEGVGVVLVEGDMFGQVGDFIVNADDIGG